MYKWQIIFYHYTFGGERFANEAEALHYVSKTNKKRFSILDEIPRFGKIDGKY